MVTFTRPPQTMTTTETATSTVTTTLVLPCGLPVWNSSQSSSSEVPVLLMQPSSTAYVCVTYQSLWRGNSSEYQTQFPGFQNYQFGLSISKEQCSATGEETSCSPNAIHSFITSAAPSSIQLVGTTNYVYVVYSVTSLSNSTGFYDNSVPYLASCVTMPMAVGYAASRKVRKPQAWPSSPTA